MGQKLSCFFSGICAAGVENAVEMSEVREAAILQLDIDCFQELFEYLSLEDLISVGQTCKRLQQVAGYFFQQNYSMLGVNGTTQNKIRKTWVAREKYIAIKIDCFAAFIKNIDIVNLQYFLNIQSKFHRLKQIELYKMENTDVEMIIDGMKPILSKLKELHMSSCDLDKFHDVISLCPNITHLTIRYCRNTLNWIHRKYPTLEYLKIFAPTDKPVELPRFLEQNPNIRKLAIDFDSFWVNRDALKEADLKLDELAILINCSVSIEPDQWCDLLNEFYALGFFKRLHLYIGVMGSTWNQRLANRLGTVNGLVKLKFQYLIDQETLSGLIDLEELGGNRMYPVSNLEMMSTKLVNLRRINLVEAEIDHILPFIRNSVKMQKIQVQKLAHGTHFKKDTGVIDLMNLNKEREQLLGAQKITLYVKEETFLATKWALGETDFRLIRLKREGTFDFDDDFNRTILYLKGYSIIGRIS